MNNITYKYREELPTVINNVSFEIQKSQKIGVVGRTGSGKSTLTLGLMRILELAKDSQVFNSIFLGIDLLKENKKLTFD